MKFLNSLDILGSGGTLLDVQGSQGQLFSVTDSLSGSIFAVSDISGVPILDVNSSGTSYFTGNVGIGTSAPAQKLHIVGERLRLDGTHIEINPTSASTSYLSSGTNTTNFFIRNRDAGVLTFGTSDLERMRILSGGNVGIGLTDPDSKLDINAGVTNNIPGPAVRISKGASPIGLIRYDTVVIEANDVATIRIGESDGTVSSIMSGDNNLRINSTDPIKFYTEGTTTGEAHAGQGGTFAMIINNSQNVGIGTTAPATKLHIQEGNTNILIGSDDTYGQNYSAIGFGGLSNGSNRIFAGYDGSSIYDDMYYAAGTGKGHQFRVNGAGSTSMIITSGGNVGIGTTAPSQKLHVSSGKVLVDVTSSIGTELILQNLAVDQFAADKNYHEINFITSSTSSETTGGYVRIKAGQEVSGNDNRSYLGFWTAPDDGAVSEKMRITSGGNVGIGTTAPVSKLDIRGRVDINLGSEGLYFKAGGDTANNGRPLEFTSSSNNGSNGALHTINATSGNGAISLNTAGVSRLFLDRLGNVGVGTTSPVAPLDVSSASNGNRIILRSTVAPASTPSMTIGTQYYYTGTTFTGGSQIVFEKDNATAGNYGHHLQFWTRANGSSAAEKMRISSAGNVGIGTTAPSVKFQVDAGSNIASFRSVGSGQNNKEFLIQTGGDRVVLDSKNADDGTAAALAFELGSSEKMRIIASGNVGIGTTSPSDKLTVNGNLSVFTNKIYNGSASNSAGLDFVGSKANIHGYHGITFNSSNAGIGSQTERMRITSAGNVGIGTTDPDVKFQVQGGAVKATTSDYASPSTGGAISMFQDNNDYGTIWAVSDYNGGWADVAIAPSGGNVGIGTTAPGAKLQLGTYPVAGKYINQATYPDVPSEHMMHITAPSTSAYYGGGISFGETAFTAANIVVRDAGGSGALDLCFGTGTSAGVTEKMRIANNGNVGIGTDNPGQKLEVNGNIKIGDAQKSLYGTGNDLEIYHDGIHSYITNNTGDLTIDSQGDDLILKAADDFILYVAGTEIAIQADSDGRVALRYDNTIRFQTTSTGVEVTGKITNLTAGTGNLDAVNVQQLNDATTGALIFKGTWSAASTTTGVHALGSTSTIIVLEDPNLGVSIGSTVTGTGIPAGTTVTTYYNSGAFGLSAAITMVNGAVATFTTVGGIPDLSRADQKVTGNYYICETAGVATPNGTGTTPDDWAVGDWVAFSDLATDAWQKIDNSSVLSGAGTGGTVPVWAGSGTSVTLADAPITVSGNNATFAGDVSLTGGSLSISGDGSNAVTFTETGAGKMTVSAADDIILDAGSDIVLDAGGDDLRLKVSGTEYAKFNNSSSNLNIFSSIQDKAIKFIGNDNGTEITALTLNMADGGDANFAGNVDLGDASNISMTTGSAGQLQILGSGYTGAIALDGDAMHIYHNSSSRDLILGTNETARLTISGDSGNTAITGVVTAPTFSGDLNGTINTATTGATQTAGDNSTKIATTAYADAAAAAVPIGSYLPLAGGTLTGNLTGTSATFVGAAASGAPLVTIENNSSSTATSYGLLVKGGGNSASGKTFEVRDDNGNTDLIVKGNGNVGIGMAAPSEKLEVDGSVLITAALLSNQENTDVDTGAETVASVLKATYTAAFFDFVIKNGTNLRAGTVFACHDGTNVVYTETSTNDLGDTSDVILSVDISGTDMRLRATATSDDWIIKSLIRAI